MFAICNIHTAKKIGMFDGIMSFSGRYGGNLRSTDVVSVIAETVGGEFDKLFQVAGLYAGL